MMKKNSIIGNVRWIIQVIALAIVITVFCWPLYLVVGYQYVYEKSTGKKMKHATGSSGMAEMLSIIAICFVIAMFGYGIIAYNVWIAPWWSSIQG